VPADFGPDTRFELSPVSAAPFRVLQESWFEKLKSALLADRLEPEWEPEVTSQIRRAANDAAALAWITQYPLLVFPVLFEEKADAALLVSDRQEAVRQRSRELLGI
jgi:hypothetical protein